jgi:hypothetical protein
MTLTHSGRLRKIYHRLRKKYQVRDTLPSRCMGLNLKAHNNKDHIVPATNSKGAIASVNPKLSPTSPIAVFAKYVPEKVAQVLLRCAASQVDPGAALQQAPEKSERGKSTFPMTSLSWLSLRPYKITWPVFSVDLGPLKY